VAAGAAVDQQAEKGRKSSPAFFAFKLKSIGSVAVLAAAGANIRWLEGGSSPMHAFAGLPQHADLMHRLVAADRRLAYMRDQHGRTPLGTACRECRASMEKALFLLGRYELLNAENAKHRSATCVVLFAHDAHAAQPGDDGKAPESQEVRCPPDRRCCCGFLQRLRNRERQSCGGRDLGAELRRPTRRLR